MGKFVEVHILQDFPLSCINRDDNNRQKSVSLGGVRRARWSSQSQKHLLRRAFGENFDVSVSTRQMPLAVTQRVGEENKNLAAWVTAATGLKVAKKDEKQDDGAALTALAHTSVRVNWHPDAEDILTELVEGLSDEARDHINSLSVESLASGAIEQKAKKAKGDAPGTPAVVPSEKVTEELKSIKKASKEALKPSGLVDTAMFGRMLAEVPDGTVDGAMSVAHAFTTHADGRETDFFTAVDDLNASLGIQGAAHSGHRDLSSGTFYRYAVVDVNELNAGPAGEYADDALMECINRFIITQPDAMKRSTAPYTDPALVMVTVTERPQNHASAFINPMSDDYIQSSADSLMSQRESWVNAYTPDEKAAFFCHGVSVSEGTNSTDVRSLSGLLGWLKDAL